MISSAKALSFITDWIKHASSHIQVLIVCYWYTKCLQQMLTSYPSSSIAATKLMFLEYSAAMVF